MDNQIPSQALNQQILHWSSMVSDSVHVCVDVMGAEYQNFSIVFMIRWFSIGYSISRLTQLWKDNKERITTHSNITEWLPFIVKQRASSNLLPHLSYTALRIYARVWERREIVAAIPRLTGKDTHRIHEMNRWIRCSAVC